MLRDGEPCSHKGCLNHISHPCEGCGRIGGRYIVEFAEEANHFGFSVTYDGDKHTIRFGTACNRCGEYFEADEIGVYCEKCKSR